MALIKNQSNLKRMIFAKKEAMNTEEIFTSNTYAEFLNQIVQGIVPNYTPNVRVAKDFPYVACTDGDTTTIGLNNPFAESVKTPVEKNNCYVGLNLHETGHVLFSDFKLMEKVVDNLRVRRIYPAPSKGEVSEKSKETVENARNTSLFIQYLMDINNCIEDGFVDRAMMHLVPGYGRCLRFIRDIDRRESPTYSEMLKRGYTKESIFLNCVLFYARFGFRAYEDKDEDDELVKAFLPCEAIIADAVRNPIPMKRMKASWAVFSKFLDFLNLEIEKDSSEEDKKSGSGDSEGTEGEGTDGESSDSDSKSGESEGTPSDEPASSPVGEDGEPKKSPAKSLEERMKDAAPTLPNVEKDVNRARATSPKSEAIKTAEEALKEERFEAPAKKDSDVAGEKLMESLKEKAAAEEISKEQEVEIKKEMEKEMNTDCKGLHAGVHSQVIRSEPSEAGKHRYNADHRDLDTEVKRFIKDFKKEIDERQIGGCQKGLFFGKELTVEQIYRKDKRIFNNKIAPEDIPDMAVGVLVDLSGSMNCGERMPKARECAYITYRFCQEMGIPCFVIGHTVLGRKMTYISVADEYSLDKRDAERIFSLEARGDNRDGLALRYCYRKLQNIEAEQKILCVISDGQPCDYSSDGVEYSGSNGNPDCRAAVKEAIKKSGIQTIVAGIGSDADSIKQCYKDGVSDKNSATFLDFSDMKNLSKCFIKVLKRMLD